MLNERSCIPRAQFLTASLTAPEDERESARFSGVGTYSESGGAAGGGVDSQDAVGAVATVDVDAHGCVGDVELCVGFCVALDGIGCDAWEALCCEDEVFVSAGSAKLAIWETCWVDGSADGSLVDENSADGIGVCSVFGGQGCDDGS